MTSMLSFYGGFLIKMEKYDLAIIGTGPIGLFAASFANLHGLKTISFDALDEVGGISVPSIIKSYSRISSRMLDASTNIR